MALLPLPEECEALLPDVSVVAEEMGFGQGWNSPSHTLRDKSAELELWLELGPFHLYSCNDLITNCFKLICNLKVPTQGVEIS